MAERTLRLVLRVIGTSGLFALIFVVAPFSWMDRIHAGMGMGRLPEQPVVGYLTRSVSFLYALLGGLFWTLSFDLQRYRSLLLYLGLAVTVFGVSLIGIGWWEDLPLVWKLWEGPFTVALGITIFMCARSLRLAGQQRQGPSSHDSGNSSGH